jgi:hypothetical protein
VPTAKPGAALEVDRCSTKEGQVSLGRRYNVAAEIIGGMMASI